MVDGVQYQFALSFPVDRPAIVVAYQNDTKLEIPLNSAPIPDRDGVAPTWRGKHSDKAFGKYEVATLIKAHMETQ